MRCASRRSGPDSIEDMRTIWRRAARPQPEILDLPGDVCVPSARRPAAAIVLRRRRRAAPPRSNAARRRSRAARARTHDRPRRSDRASGRRRRRACRPCRRAARRSMIARLNSVTRSTVRSAGSKVHRRSRAACPSHSAANARFIGTSTNIENQSRSPMPREHADRVEPRVVAEHVPAADQPIKRSVGSAARSSSATRPADRALRQSPLDRAVGPAHRPLHRS